MSIMILRGPASSECLIRGPQPLPREVLRQLVERAADAGKTLALRACGSEQELIDALRLAQQARVELVVIDPGACVQSTRLHRVLSLLACPYVEAHADRADRLRGTMPDGLGHRVAAVHGYCAQSYTLALSIALEHLGCDAVGEAYHVGT